MTRFAFVVIAAALAAPAFGQDATLVRTAGPVSVLAEGARRFVPAKDRMDLIYGDTIRVGKFDVGR